MISQKEAIDALKQVNDPELKMNVWFLGLIYDVQIKDDIVSILMTFTTPFCPYGPNLVEEIRERIINAGAKDVRIELTFEPKWEPSEDVKLALGMA